MKSEKLSFESDLWGQYNQLHERLKKKKTYLKSLIKSLEPIYDSFKEVNKKLESFKIAQDPTISQSLYTESEASDSNEPKLYGISLTINEYIKFWKELIDYSNQTLFHITNGLEDLLKKIEKEKEEYNNLVKCMKTLSENKNIMDKNMKLYHQKMSAAERSVLDLKNTEIIQLSINNDISILENKKLLEDKANQLTNDSVKPFKTYLDSVNKVNEIREESIEKQKHLLYKYQNIEEEVGKTNTNFAKIILLSLENMIQESLEKGLANIQNIIKNIHINRDIKYLIIDYKGNEKPEEEILFINFPSVINFDESDDNKTFEIYKSSVEFIKGIIEQEYPKYDEQFEGEKNDLRETLTKLFHEFDTEKAKKIQEYIKNNKMHRYFLILLSKLRASNKYEQSKTLIDFLGELLNYILDKSQETKNFDNSKNCIILSQTFYYNNNGEKYYIVEKIKNHNWLSKPEYWIKFGELMFEPELNKFIERHPEITMEDILNNNEKITSGIKGKLSDIIFTQILPFTNNMKEFGIDLKKIVEIIEEILQQYDFLSEDQKNNVFSLISEDQEEIDKLRKKFKKEKKKEIERVKEKEKEINNNIKMSNDKITSNNGDIKSKTNEIKNKMNNEIENKFKQNLNKNNLNLLKNIEKNKEDIILPLPARSSTVASNKISENKENKESKDNENKTENKSFGILSNIKNKFLNKEKKNKEREEKKEDKKENKKDNTKDNMKDPNTEPKNIIKQEKGNQMIKVSFNQDKMLTLKPIPKTDKNTNVKTEINKKETNPAANPFGVVLKKIDKGKYGK